MSHTLVSYSLIVMHDDVVYAVRDPFGNRPLCIGQLLPVRPLASSEGKHCHPLDLSHSCHILVLSCLIKCSSFVLQLLSLSFLPHSSLSCSSWQSFCCVLFLQLMSGWIKVISIMVYSGDWKEIDGWVVSSESCSFQSVGAKYFREVLPGI